MFYVMEFMDGRVEHRLDLPDYATADRAVMYDAMNGVLAQLHGLDVGALGFSDFGRPRDYLNRQVRRWTTQYQATQTEALADMDDLIEWLANNTPVDSGTTLVHGDYRLENMIFHKAEPRPVAVIDWELSTLGDPFADLAYNCLPYHMPDEVRGDLMQGPSGIPSEADYIALYCRRSGRILPTAWPVYLVIALFRLAAISQGVYHRGLQGNAASPAALSRRDTCRQLPGIAVRML